MPQHHTKYYEDGFKLVEFCYQCGQEGLDLKLNPQCSYVAPLSCQDCGYVECKCEKYRSEMKTAIDKTNSRN